MKIFKDRSRESTDLEEYIIIEPKNIVQLQKFKKLWRAPFGEKREDFFYRKMLGRNTRFARLDYTRKQFRWCGKVRFRLLS